jgi:hypothetical protein
VTIVNDWLSLRSAVVAAVEAAMPAGVLAQCAVQWEDGARSLSLHHALLSVVSATFEDRDSALSIGGPQTLESKAVIVVQLKAESPHDSADLDALWLIEQCRLGLRKVSVKEVLDTAGVAISVFPSSTRNIGGYADDHALSVHALEFTCCTTFGLTPDEDAGLIELVEADGTLTDVDDTELDIEIDLVDPDPEP